MTMNAKFKTFARDHQRLVSAKIQADDLLKFASVYDEFAKMVIEMETRGFPFGEEIVDAMHEWIMVCIDVYTYSESGAVLVDDHTYDMLMRIYMHASGNVLISTADYISSTSTWGFMEHEAPFMVGTVSNKLYTVDALDQALTALIRMGYRRIFYAPKFDGISVAIKWSGEEILYGITRNDGVKGQDITELVQRIQHYKKIFTSKMPAGYYKCEIVVTSPDFEELIKLKGYANRRSAASAIVNTPKNLQYAQFATILPLAYVDFEGTKITYLAKQYLEGVVETASKDMRTEAVLSRIEEILEIIRQPTYYARVDGVVIFPVPENDKPNLNDIMASTLAYKVNTQETITQVEGVYMSVGRTGLGKPMAKVVPCEVNETIVTDVSLGSMEIFSGLGLHRNEEVLVYSAGDVIPQIRLPDERKYPKNSTRLRMDIHCPYCGSTMRFKTGSTADIYCLNQDCPRVRSGKIVNFLDKLEIAEGFRDEIFYKLVDNHVIHNITDLFRISEMREKVAALIGHQMTENLIRGLKDLTEKEFEISEVVGACGIDGVATRTCQKIFREYTVNYLLKQKPERMYLRLMTIEGIGRVTAETICMWLDENRDFLEFLMDHMKVIDDPVTYGNVVFTGFRNKDYAQKLKGIGFPVVETVNSETVACIYVGDTHTGNAKKASLKGVPLIHFSDIDYVMKQLQDESDFIQRTPEQFEKMDIIRGIRRRL